MLSFRLFAGTDIGLRDNNEDNFTVCPDLAKDEWMIPANQQENIALGSRGCLMVVADGMGGMNAGEVASDIAIKTVQAMFSPAKMPADVTKSPSSIKKYIKKTIIEADRQVKKHSKKDPSTAGMGSTIVMAWLYGDSVYVGWMGDSRAYSYIPEKGISRLSRDHSYVQELVDANMITEEDAMLHPQSNVIMRSLGDITQKAKPDVICHPVSKDEIILLCSDGLCGVCTDEAIAEIISQTSDDLRSCKESLTNAALEADGSDNITIALMQIADTPRQLTEGAGPMYSKTWLTWQNVLFVLFALTLIMSLGVAGYKSCGFTQPQDSLQDSVRVKCILPKDVAAKESISNAGAKKDIPKAGGQLYDKRTQHFMEEITNDAANGSNSSVEAKEPEIELTHSKPAELVEAVPVKAGKKDTIN
jgi:protein phosphatase